MEGEKKLPIKKWATDDRPREKLLEKGIESLSDSELIAVLISSGTREMSAVELAKQILQASENNLNLLGKQSVKDLMRFKGIGEAKAVSIAAALELGKRRDRSEVLERKKITCSKDVFSIFRSVPGDLPYEEFWMLMLNQAGKIITQKRIGSGGIAHTEADLRLILKEALLHNATGIVVCHNHPSGNLQPSRADLDLTKRLDESCKLLNIKLMDHLIVSFDDYFSFSDEELLV